ncbi:MAG: hypothetical protein KA296_16620 [Marinobacter sp.]|nr:hypothetical protein [Marinobacter sp.]
MALAQSDIVTLHEPGSDAATHMISGREFAKMKPSVALINTARGSILDTQALLRDLANGKVAAAGLDVLPDEPSISEEAELIRSFFDKKHDLETLFVNHVLLQMRNVVITPHSAFNTKEAVERILATTGENIIGFVSGEPGNVVNTQ